MCEPKRVTTGILAFAGGRCYLRLAAQVIFHWLCLFTFRSCFCFERSQGCTISSIINFNLRSFGFFHWLTFLWKMTYNRKLFFLTGILTLLPHLFSVELNISMFWLRLMKTPLRRAFLFVFLICYSMKHVYLLSRTLQPYCIPIGTFFNFQLNHHCCTATIK